jgi:hypothetical protein
VAFAHHLLTGFSHFSDGLRGTATRAKGGNFTFQFSGSTSQTAINDKRQSLRLSLLILRSGFVVQDCPKHANIRGVRNHVGVPGIMSKR